MTYPELSSVDEARLSSDEATDTDEILARLQLLTKHRPTRYSLYLNVAQALRSSGVRDEVYSKAEIREKFMLRVVEDPTLAREFVQTRGEGIL